MAIYGIYKAEPSSLYFSWFSAAEAVNQVYSKLLAVKVDLYITLITIGLSM